MRWLLALLLTSTTADARPLRCGDAQLEDIAKTMSASKQVTLRCKPVRAKAPLLLVEAQGDQGGIALLVAADGSVRWSDSSYAGTPGRTNTYALVDLDRDGRDELMVHETYEGHMGSGSDTLRLLAITDEEVVPAGELGLAARGGSRTTGANGCSGSWAIVGGTHVRVQITGSRGHDKALEPAPDACPLDGVHRYRWTGIEFSLAD